MDDRVATRWGLFVGIIVIGTASYYMTKLQNTYPVEDFESCPQGNTPTPTKQFFHPYVQVSHRSIQTCMMFIAEAFCLILFAFYKRRYRREFLLRQDFARMSGKLPPQFYIYLLPSIFDFFSAVCMYTAQNFISGSTFQFFRCGTIITTGIIAYRLTKVKFEKNQIIGSAIAVIALALTALTQLLLEEDNSTSTDSEKDSWKVGLGMILMSVAIIVEGFFYAIEQRLFQKYHIEPVKLVGMEGVSGVILSLAAIMIASSVELTHISQDTSVCVDGKKYAEGGLTALREIFGNSALLGYCIGMMCFLCLFNILGVYVTKLINAQARCLMQTARALLIWVVGLIITWAGEKGYESDKLLIIMLKLVALALLLFAVLFYTELICSKDKKKQQKFEDDDDEGPQQNFLG